MRDHTQGVASFHASRMRRFHMQLCSILRLSRPWEKETPTADLVFESEHVPVSVSLADTFDGEPKHISAKYPNELLRKFWEALVRRGEILRERIRQRYVPEDYELFSKRQQVTIRDWCNIIPVLGFNSGKYDLNVIKKYFVTDIGAEKQVTVAKKQGRIMFLSPSNFKFLGKRYEKWVKTYGSSQTKSWLPYEWFDCTAKLDYESLPSYRCWF